MELGELIPLTIPEVRRLVYRLVVRILAPPEAILHWSHWRRLHHARAKRAHYKRRLAHICTAAVVLGRGMKAGAPSGDEYARYAPLFRQSGRMY